MSKEETFKNVLSAIRDEDGFSPKFISDEFIRAWFDFYYERTPDDEHSIYNGIMSEYDSATDS